MEDEERKRESVGEESHDLVELVKVRVDDGVEACADGWLYLLFARTARERREGTVRALRTRQLMFCSTAAMDVEAMVTVLVWFWLCVARRTGNGACVLNCLVYDHSKLPPSAFRLCALHMHQQQGIYFYMVCAPAATMRR